MEAIVQEIEVERLLPIFDIPKEIWNSRVEVTIKPIEKISHGTTAEKIRQYRKKYNREVFVDHLKEQVVKGHSFGFDVQKVIDGTETEEETQARYRLEKQTWGNEAGRED
jgi:phage-related protein